MTPYNLTNPKTGEIYKRLNQQKSINMEVEGFYIISPGDSSVGVFQADWELKGGFHFDNENDFNGFKNALRQAFDYIADDIYIETFEESRERMEKEDAAQVWLTEFS